MVCKRCNQELGTEEYFCGTCGTRTGVEAKRNFKWSLNCSGIGCSATILCILIGWGLSIYASQHRDFLSTMGGIGILLGFIGFFGLCSGLIGLIIGLVGFSKKNYQLVKKGKK